MRSRAAVVAIAVVGVMGMQVGNGQESLLDESRRPSSQYASGSLDGDSVFAGATSTDRLDVELPSDQEQVDCYGDACRFDFSAVPPVPRPLVRPGMFFIPPSGPGYYSVLDCFTDTWRESAPKYPFQPLTLSTLSFFDADWRFVDDPNYDADLLERIKRLQPGCNWLLSTGGQMWFRYSDAYNSRLTETNNDYTIGRIRPYLDVWYQDRLRFFIEGMFAETTPQSVPPLATDINRADFQNVFLEAPIGEIADKQVFARIGRQEIQLGSQRLVGTPDWANTRRTFQGGRLYRVGEQWDADLFWLQPVLPNSSELDSGDNNQNFAGAWVTYRPRAGSYVDMYYLMLNNQNQVTQSSIDRAPFSIHTIGGRYAGDLENRFLWDAEGAFQLGTRGDADVLAGMCSAGVGYHAENVGWNPTVWAVYDYASGDRAPNVDTYHTLNQLFPFLPYYLGWLDAIGRQNLHYATMRLYLYPQHWMTVLIQYQHLWLDSPTDALYNVAGNAFRRDPTGQSGTDVGDKLDCQMNFHLSKRTDLLVGYTYLWGGDFLRNTASPTSSIDSSVFYLSASCRW